MFKVVDDTELSFVVNADYPLRGGKTKTISFDITAERPDTTDLNELISASQMANLVRLRTVLEEHVTGWTNFLDIEKKPIEFNDENFKQFLSDPSLLIPAAKAFGTACNGGARAKNSKARLAGTRN